MICFICHDCPDIEHSHHLTPQAAGGKEGIEIILCANCHNAVHKEIQRLLALNRKGKGGASSVNWKTCKHSQEIEFATKVVLSVLFATVQSEG